jgi:hypothetical protein
VSRFIVLRAWTNFQLYRGRRVPILCFARPDSFSTEMRVSGTVFTVCTLGVVSRSTEGVGSHFKVFKITHVSTVVVGSTYFRFRIFFLGASVRDSPAR